MPGGEVIWPMDGGRGMLCTVKELLVELGAVRSGARRLRILAGHQRGVGAGTWGHTDCVQEGAGPEEVLQHVDDGVADGVEHLDGQVIPHRAWRGACI